jgi:hypothetical protein
MADEQATKEFHGEGQEAPEIPPGPDEFVDDTWPDGQAKITPVPGSSAGPWFVEERRWPRFKKEEVPTRKRSRTEEQQLDTREQWDGKGKCWTECRVIERTYETPYFMVTQYVERWRINRSLKSWYETVTGEAQTMGSTGVTIATTVVGKKTIAEHAAKSVFVNATAKLMGKQAATQVAKTAVGEMVGLGAGAGAAIGLGVTLFVATSYLMRHFVQDAVRISASWELVSGLSDYGDEKLVKQTTAFWKRCGEIRDCLAPEPKTPEKPTPAIPGKYGIPKIPMIWLGGGLFGFILLGGLVVGLTGSRSDSGVSGGDGGAASAGPAAPAATGAQLLVGNMFPSDSLQNDSCGNSRQPHHVYAFFVDVAVFGQASPPPSLIRSMLGRPAHVTLAGAPDAGTYDTTIAETLGRVQIRVDGPACPPSSARSTFVDLRIDGVTLRPNGNVGFIADIPLPP